MKVNGKQRMEKQRDKNLPKKARPANSNIPFRGPKLDGDDFDFAAAA